MKVDFFIRFHTKVNQILYISGNHALLGDYDTDQALQMNYYNNDFWQASIEIDEKKEPLLRYKYLLKNVGGEWIPENENTRIIQHAKSPARDITLIDTWNNAGDFENAFYTAPFKEIFLYRKVAKPRNPKNFNYQFRVKAPLLQKDETVCISGGSEPLGNWSLDNVQLLQPHGNWFEISLQIENNQLPFEYKYGVYNTKTKTFIRFEDGPNRQLPVGFANNPLTILHDGFVHLPNNTWHGAGVAIPVFSLRSSKSFGTGEFNDLKLLVDWAKITGLKMIQLLPVNDTIATNTYKDSYPYASISAFALHPLYVNLEKVAGRKHASHINSLKRKQKQLNALPEMDYEEVIKYKLQVLQELYELDGKEIINSEGFATFFEKNNHWLVPYAAFSYLRDKNKTSHYNHWNTNSVYDKSDIAKLTSKKSKAYKSIAFHYYTQYHLHLQLKEATEYAHKNGIALKGDIPIGIYRYGVDAWMEPDLYHMDQQTGAPPDDFAVKGQNWGFPTYNWQKMQQDGFAWWRRRFEQMSEYFSAFRIDHILGFFRIWSIPRHAVEGIMGHFVPAIPLYASELNEHGIHADLKRFYKPFITEEIIYEIFGNLAEQVLTSFVVRNDWGSYSLEFQVETQLQVENYLSTMEPSEENNKIKQGLFDLISNVILLPDSNGGEAQFHFRFGMENTTSFRYLDDHTKGVLKYLYNNYFFDRQDAFWKKEAMNKLPSLKQATNMLICGEDLGMVPHSVPEVMKQLGILSLEIQRMPKDAKKLFFHPNDAPYLSVVTPSTHDMSTIRGWWEEDRSKTQHFFNHELGQHGEAPHFCEPWINRAIILQHLYSPAMWSIFQLQDLLGMDGTLRRSHPAEERINIPADPKHYWRYRMHIPLEQLLKEKAFNQELSGYIDDSGRG